MTNARDAGVAPTNDKRGVIVMKTIGPVLCLMIAFAGSSTLARATTAPATEPSGYTATRIVGIASFAHPFGTPALNDWAADLHDQALKLEPEYLGSSTPAEDILTIQATGFTPIGSFEQGIEISINVNPRTSATKPNAPAFADALVTRLQKLVEEADAKARQSEIDPIKNDIRETQDRVARTRAELNQLRDQIREKTGRLEVSAGKLKEVALKLDDQRQDLELSKLGKQARVKAIQDAVARLSKQVEQKVKNDPIAAELQKVVDAREIEVEQAQAILKARGTSPKLQDAIAQAAEAKAKLLERQRESAADAGGGQIDSLNQELTTLNIDLAEIDAKLTALNQQRDGLQWALDHADQLTRLSATLADEQKELSDAKQKLQQTQDRLNKTPPVTVRVVRSSNGP